MNTIFQSEPPAELEAPRGLRAARPLQWLEYVLLLAGIVGVGIYVWSVAESSVYQHYEEYALESAMRGQSATWLGYIKYLVGTGAQSSDGDEAYKDLERAAPRPVVPPDGLIGRIEIPRIGVSAIIREGVDGTTLRRAAGHVPGTALPGQDGNVAVAAHRDTFFRGVRNIQLNDEIRVTTTDGTYDYLVRDTQIVRPEDVHVLDPRQPRELTLITCYPFNYVGHAPKRYIVRAVPVAGGALPAAAFGTPARAQPAPPAALRAPARPRSAAAKSSSVKKKRAQRSDQRSRSLRARR